MQSFRGTQIVDAVYSFSTWPHHQLIITDPLLVTTKCIAQASVGTIPAKQPVRIPEIVIETHLDIHIHEWGCIRQLSCKLCNGIALPILILKVCNVTLTLSYLEACLTDRAKFGQWDSQQGRSQPGILADNTSMASSILIPIHVQLSS